MAEEEGEQRLNTSEKGEESDGASDPPDIVFETNLDPDTESYLWHLYPVSKELQLNGSTRDFTVKKGGIESRFNKCDFYNVLEGKRIVISRVRGQQGKALGIAKTYFQCNASVDITQISDKLLENDLILLLSGAAAMKLRYTIVMPSNQPVQPVLEALFDAFDALVKSAPATTFKRPDIGILESNVYISPDFGGAQKSRFITFDWDVDGKEVLELLCKWNPTDFKLNEGTATFAQTNEHIPVPLDIIDTPSMPSVGGGGNSFLYIAGVQDRSWMDQGGALIELLARLFRIPSEDLRAIYVCNDNPQRKAVFRGEVYGLIIPSGHSGGDMIQTLIRSCKQGPIKFSTGPTRELKLDVFEDDNQALLFGQSLPAFEDLVSTHMPNLSIANEGALSRQVMEDLREQRAQTVLLAQQFNAIAETQRKDSAELRAQTETLNTQTESLGKQTESLKESQEAQSQFLAGASEINKQLLEHLRTGGLTGPPTPAPIRMVPAKTGSARLAKQLQTDTGK